MSAPVTSTEFIDRIRKSGLFTDAHLDRYLRKRVKTTDTHAEPIANEMIRAGLLTSFQAKQILGGRTPDFFIAGKYRILELLGRGGMGSVFLCEHLRMRRLVAVKVLPQECESDPAVLARFEREAQAVAALDHANVVHAYDIDHADGRHFLVMEFIDGIDLQTFVSSHGPMSPSQAAWCVVQTARGLNHAWLAGWVHRDIKPGNLLMDRAGSVKILDMGLARIFDSKDANVTSLFNENCILGTADYLSPEQAAGSNDSDIRADIYSLGATFYFLLAGRAPFEDGNVSQKLLWHRTLNPMPIRERRPDVPEGMATIMTRMLEKDPRNRYATPGDLAEELLPFCDPPPPPPTEMQMPTWSPAVVERIRACHTPTDQHAPQTVPLVIKQGPDTDLARTGKLVIKPTQKNRLPRVVIVPTWAAVAAVGLLVTTIGWIIYRETHLPGSRIVYHKGEPVLSPIMAEDAEQHVDAYVCVDLPVLAAEIDKNLYLYATPTKDAKGFFILIDWTAIANGRFKMARPELLEQEFRGKQVRVVGRILRHDDDPKTYRTGAPFIKVVDPKQIQILGDAESR